MNARRAAVAVGIWRWHAAGWLPVRAWALYLAGASVLVLGVGVGFVPMFLLGVGVGLVDGALFMVGERAVAGLGESQCACDIQPRVTLRSAWETAGGAR
ncbi:hypothetical protein [Embleya sp. NPDC005575]|uniref:hypothetical protein n=1 Tax=Embleya sp. NPDC005575 TaxID=3156892 RepID=UPI0033BABAB1